MAVKDAEVADRIVDGDGLRLVDGGHRLPFRSGLQVEFPPLKSLGATTRLPATATPLIGRDGEIDELVTMNRSGVRLATLTGTGGTGKTRLAIGVAVRLVEDFPDGACFVPLAAVTTFDVMWTSMSEVLDLPLDSRTPDGLLGRLEQRKGVFVLDNLEQVGVER